MSKALPRDEMPELLDRLRGGQTEAAGAAPARPRPFSRIAWLLRRRGHSVGKYDKALRRLRALVENHVDDLRDDVAGALDDDGVADRGCRGLRGSAGRRCRCP